MANLEKQHAIVKGSLSAFVNAHIAGADLSVVDEIVLSYVISILEEASADPCFDVDGFIEMMSAYFPDFSAIDPATICSWIFQLEGELSALNQAAADADRCSALKSLSLSEMLPESIRRARPPSVSEQTTPLAAAADISLVPIATTLGQHLPAAATLTTQSNPTSGVGKRTQHLSETSDGGSTDSSTGCCADFFTDECDVLQEMFPDSSFLEVKHCVSIANGDIDRATQMLLDRQDAGQSLTANPASLHAPKSQVIDENELKNRIISR